jgi:uncharacterized protein (TIGR00369 family)
VTSDVGYNHGVEQSESHPALRARNPIRELRRYPRGRMLTPDVVTEPLTAAELLFGVTVLGRTREGIQAGCRLPSLPTGSNHSIGRLGLLADMTAGRTVRAFHPPEVMIRTANLRVDVGDRPPRSGEKILATGTLLASSAAQALSEAVLTGSDGAVVARCTARFIVVPGAAPVGHRRARLQPDPAAAPLETMPGLLERAGPHGVALTAQPDGRFGNHDGMMHGGVQVALADAALHSAAREACGGNPALIDLTVRYMRPMRVDGSTIELQATVERAGRLVTVTRARGSDEQGRLLMTAEATFSSAGRVGVAE